MTNVYLRNRSNRFIFITSALLLLLSAGSRAIAQSSGQGLPQLTSQAWASSPGNVDEAEIKKERDGHASAKAVISANPNSNFSTFSQASWNRNPEVALYNKGNEQHPELGVLFPEVPCTGCYELIDKRTETQKYYVREGSDARQFILHSSPYPMHYKDASGRWMTVREKLQKDVTQPGVYHTVGKLTDITVNTMGKYSELTGRDGTSFRYNNDLELVYIQPGGTEQVVGKANWSNHTVGDDGVRIKDAWPGIDIEIAVLAGGVKTGFIVKQAMPAYAGGQLVIRDHMAPGKGISIDLPENKLHDGAITVKNKNAAVLSFGNAFAYEMNSKEPSETALSYKRHDGNVVDIVVPGSLLNKGAAAYPLVIDPLATGILSSGFSYTATFPPAAGTFCNNVNNLTIPAGATFSDVKVTFSFYGPPATSWGQATFSVAVNGGLCPSAWVSCTPLAFSSGIPGNTCGYVPGSSFYAGFAACLPPFNCNSYTLPFEMRTAQRQTATAACVQTVYATASGFYVVVEGATAVLPTISPSTPTTLCMPSTVTFTGSPLSAVWSSTSPGVATVSGGVVTGVANGTTNIVLTASGCSVSVPVTVGTTPTITGAPNICFPGSTTLTGAPAGGVWTSSLPGIATITAGGLVNAVSIGTTFISYNTGVCTAVRPFDVNSPAAVAPASQPTGISFPSTTPTGGTINFTPNGSTGYLVVASTSSSLSATPVLYTTYATGSSFGGGIVVQGSTSGSSPAYTTSILNSNTRYYIFVFAFNNNCIGPQYCALPPLTGSFNTCIIAPTGLVTGTPGVNSIPLSWSASPAGGGYITPVNYNVYAYLDAALTMLVPGFPLMAGTGTAFTVGGLMTGTQYWFRVAPADACNSMSNVATASTICTAAGSVPYLQTFEIGTLIGDDNPNCMTSNMQNCVLTGVATSSTYLGTINTNHTPGGTKFYGTLRGGACSAGWANQWLLLPQLNLVAGTTYTFSLWYRTDGFTWQTMRVQYSTVGTLPAVGSTVMGGTPGNIGPGVGSFAPTGYTQYIQTFTVPASGIYFIGIDVESGAAASQIALDDIEVCAVPTVTATNSAPPYCDPATVFLSSSGTVWANTYSWSGPGSYSSTLASPPAISGLGAGTYTYSVTAVNDPISLGFGGYCADTATTSFTVSPPLSPITGVTDICVGQITTLSNPTPGGTWSSSVLTVGTVNATTGAVTGTGPGTTTITYTTGGCYTTTVVSVTASPSAITGPLNVCLGGFTTLNSTPAGGTWSSTVLSVGTISTGGVVYGAGVGTTTISYSFGGSCFTTAVATVNPNPTPITGQFIVCLGATVTLNSTPSPGFWSTSSAAVAGVNPLTGVVTGNGLGTANITYTAAGGCFVWQTVTVVPAPSAVAGPTNICIGFPSATYTNITPGGTWSVSNGNITINSSTGVAVGNSAGTAVVTYALSATCFSTLTVTVLSPAPAPTGTMTVCIGAQTTLSHVTPGGAWSSICPGIATVTAGGGVVTGIGAGTCIVTYMLPTGCIATTTITVLPNPGGITGALSVCQGASTPLGNPTPSGAWSSSPTAIGTISTSGVLTGIAGGTTTVSYTLPSGCYSTATATVNPTPLAITGTPTVCVGATTALSSGTPLGAWSSTNTFVATVSGGGVVTGANPGTTIISYTTGFGCASTMTVTVVASPAGLTGPLGMCVGATTTLNSTTAGGTWSSSAPAIGSILTFGTSAGSAFGVIGGMSAGTATISYTVAGCSSTAVVTVNALPGSITPAPVCVNSTITLTATPGGGTWSSLSSNVTVGLSSGAVTGNTAGTATVTYSLGTGCTSTAVVTVNALPAIIGTAPFVVCEGSCITLTSSPAPGTWTSSNTAVGTVNTTGVVCGVGAGTTNISYTLATGCRRTQVVTVNGLPSAITGATSVCEGQCTPLASGPGAGTWSTSNASVGVVDASGSFCGVASGTTTVTFTLPTGCYRTTVMLVNPIPTGSTPASPEVCTGSCTSVAGNPAGGIWSGGAAGIATITSAGLLCGVAPGTANIVYTLASGCARTIMATVHPLPAAIGGTMAVCVNSTTTLNSSPAGGTWSSPSGNVNVNSSTGEVTGVSAGTAAVSYTLGTGCRITAIVTVHALPAVITATPGFGVCIGRTTTLNSTAGGTWSIFNPSVASISAGGVVTGGSSTGADTTLVTYTNANGCIRNAIVTVYALPTAITGTAAVCVNFTTTLNSTPSGGTWSSTLPSVATVNATTGEVTGISGPLTSVISYTLPSGCATTQVVTVYALPNDIAGPSRVCELQTITLTSPGTPGGGWSSSNTAIATVDGGGVVTGVLGTPVVSSATITYTLGTGCYKLKAVTVDPIPTAITGTLQICQTYGTATLTGTPAGGTWSSSNAGVAAINSSTGVVTAGTNGTATITYRLTATGCYRTEVVTVNQLPAAITGPAAVCRLETVTLGSTPTGGTWSSPDATVAVNASTGDVTGVTAGTATISYANGTTGCVRTRDITVNALPVAITGPLQVCEGLTTTLTNASGGGSWSASNPSVGTIDAGGVFTGINGLPAPATSTVSYTFISTGCRITADVTVNRLPSAIVGSSGFCNFTTATYSSSPAGGTWSSSNTGVVDFPNPAVGDADGVGVGTSRITYTLGTGCIATKDVFTIFAPYPITGADDVCIGDTTTVADTIAGGVWAITGGGLIATIAPATPTTAIVGGVSAGTVNISYILSTGCYSVKTMTVNPIPSGVTGALTVCEGLTTDLDNTTPGGTWSSADTSVAVVDTFSGLVTGINGGVTGRTSIITYALGTGCNAQVEVTVNPLPAVISGSFEVCEGLTTTLASGPTGGAWSSADPAVATVGSSTGIVTGIAAGALGVNGIGQTVITYTLPTSCLRTQGLTVNPLPANISGVSNICVGDMTVLGNSTPGGSWSSSNSAVAQIDAVTGIVIGMSPGNAIITYSLGTGCLATWPMTVNDNPTPIGGSLQVCAGFATNLTSGPAGGAWSQSSSSTIYGTINTVTGVVSGISGGLVPVTYTLGSGCRTTAVVTVITLPPVISGTPNLCEAGGTTTMLHSVPGGTWSISNPSLATIDATTGVVTGIMAGTAVVTYTVGTGCFNVHTITVNPLPAVITGPSPLEVCVGAQIALASATPGGAWISDATDKATIGTSTGVLTGVAAGIAPIRYHISATGCERSVTVTVNPTPAAITGNPHICMGSAVWYTSASMGGVWSISNPGVATLLATTTNVVTALPVSLGVATITYQFPGTGCQALKSVTVQPLPVVYNVTGGGSYCAGGNGVHIGLDNSQTGVSYVLYRGTVAAGYLAGTGFPLDFGLLTVAGTYTVMATNAVSGCERAMAGSATVTVISSVTPTVTLNATPDDSLCPGETVTMIPVTTTGGTAPTYVWKVNGVTVSTGPTYAFVPADGDVASVTMTSNAGCLATTTATASRTITVMPDALPVVNVLAGPNDSLCEFAPVTLTAAPMYGGSSPAFSWFVNGIFKGSGASYTYVPANGDLARVTMVSNYRCRLATTVTSPDVKLYVEPMLTPHVTIYPAPGFTVAAGKPLKLYAVATDAGANPTFQWKVNGYPVAGATADSFTYIFNDYDSITCMVTSSGICGNIGTHDWVFITVTTGTQGVAILPQDIRLHPNPNRGTFTVRGTLGNNRTEDVDVDITNMLGQVVYKGAMKSVQGRVDAQIIMDNSLANGMYILTLHVEDGKQTFHFVLEQ